MRYRSLAVILGVCLIVVTTGCGAGSVTVDADETGDDFGSLKSATLVYDPYLDDGDSDGYYVLLSNEGGMCSTLQEFLPQMHLLSDQYNEAWDDYFDVLSAWTDPNYFDNIELAVDDLCDAQTDYFTGMFELAESYYADGVHEVSIFFWDDNDYNIFPEDAATYDTDEDYADKGFFVGLSYYFGNPYAAAMDAWDGEACKDADFEDTLAEDPFDAMDALVDSWSGDNGEATVTVKSDSKIKIELSANLEDIEGNNSGTIVSEFTAKLCEIPEDVE